MDLALAASVLLWGVGLGGGGTALAMGSVGPSQRVFQLHWRGSVLEFSEDPTPEDVEALRHVWDLARQLELEGAAE